jgi:hypothetical protein
MKPIVALPGRKEAESPVDPSLRDKESCHGCSGIKVEANFRKEPILVKSMVTLVTKLFFR